MKNSLILSICIINFLLFSFSGQTVLADECPSAMVAYWHLDEAGQPYKDEFLSNQLSCEGACPAPVSGVVNGAQLFNGSTSGITVPAAPMFDWSAGGSFTIEFQLKRGTDFSAPESLISREDKESTSLMQWWIGLNTAGKLEFSLIDRNGNGPEQTLAGKTIVTDNKWHHIALVRDGAAGRTLLYVDGKLDGSQTFTYPDSFEAAAPITIGWLPAGYHYGGALDELAIYSRALSEFEISQHVTDGTVGLGFGYCYDGVPVRIMPLGDSITQGTSTFTKNKNYYVGYRQELFRGLKGKGYAVDFVGGGESAGTLAMPPFDTDHEGHAGWTDNQVADNVYSWLVANPADLVLLHIGTNNLSSDPSDVERLLDEIDRFSGDVVVLLARIINRRVYSPQTTSFNDNVEAMAKSRIAAGDKIILLNQENALIYPQDISEDNLHPTEMGYKKMASTWSAALEKVLPTANTLPVLKFSREWTHFETTAGSVPQGQTLSLDTLDGSETGFTVTSDAAWLKVTPATGGTTQAEVTVSVDSALLPVGIYTAYVTASATGYVNAVTKVTLAVTTKNSGYELLTSTSADRSNSTALGGSVLSDNAHVFVTGPTTNVRRVIFSLDGTAVMTESVAPYDFAGTAVDGNANPYDTRRLANGMHVISVVIQYYDGATKAISSTVSVNNGTVSLTANPGSLQFTAQQGSSLPGAQSITVGASDAKAAAFSASSNASWLTVSPVSGSTPASVSVSVNNTSLAPGTYNGTVTLSATGYVGASVAVTYTVSSSGGSAYNLLFSSSASRSGATSLAGKTVSGNMYVFTSPDTNVSRVVFYLDGVQIMTEGYAPYDFAGTATDGSAKPYDTKQLTDGTHVISANVEYSGKSENISATFTVKNNSLSLTAVPGSLQFAAQQGSSPGAQSITVATSDGNVTSFSASSNVSWLTVSPVSGTTPTSLSVSVNNTSLAPGTYNGTVTLAANGYVGVTVSVTYTVSSSSGSGYNLLLSSSASRSAATPLVNKTVSGNMYVFTSPDTNVSRVIFYLDNIKLLTEAYAPFDFAGTAPDGNAKPYDTNILADGIHVISAEIQFYSGAKEVVTAAFSVKNNISF
jgi:lysophospholipase L1-like esterase